MQLDGKLGAPGRLNAVAPGFLVHVLDQNSGRRFLVDTGAAFSILPHFSSLPATGQGIVGPTGSPIKCWGECEVDLKLSGQSFKWTFLQAEVQMAILGIDFLKAHRLSVDPAGGRLVQTGTGLVLTAITSPSRATASAIRTPAAVPVPYVQAALSSTAVPSTSGQAAPFSSTFPASTGREGPSISSATGPQPPVLSHRSSATGPQAPGSRRRRCSADILRRRCQFSSSCCCSGSRMW